MAISPMKPTAKGRRPCWRISRELVRRPTPAKVRRKAQRERLARLVFWSLVKKPTVAKTETSKKPRTNLGNFCQRKAALLVTAWAWPRLAQEMGEAGEEKPDKAVGDRE